MDQIFERNILDLVLFLLYVTGLATLSKPFKHVSRKIYSIAIYAGIMHLIFTFAFYFYSFVNAADAKKFFLGSYYYSWAETSYSTGQSFIQMLLFPFIHYFGMSYLGCFLLFSFISLIGVYKLFKILVAIYGYKWTNWYYLLLLPSMHFWTASLGKDSLIFFSVCYLLHSYYFKKNWKSYIIPLVLIGFTRFYILGLIGVGFFIALIFLSRLKTGYKFLLGITFILFIVLVTPRFFKSISVSNIDAIGTQQSRIQAANMKGGGAVDVKDANMLVKWVSYMFRPFIFEARSPQTLIASIENIIWIIIFYKLLINIKRKKNRNLLSPLFWVCFTCIFTITLPLTFVLANLGIAARQKIMIVPLLYVSFFIIINKSQFLSRKN